MSETSGAHPSPANGEGLLAVLRRALGNQKVAFVLVGGFNTVFFISLFAAFQYLFGDRIGRFGYMVSLVTAHAISMLVGFLLQRTLVFRVRGHLFRDFSRFLLVNLSMLGANAVLLPVFVEIFGLIPIVGQMIAAVVTAIMSYVGHKYFTFRRGKPASGLPA